MINLFDKLDYTRRSVDDIQKALEEKGINMTDIELLLYGDIIRNLTGGGQCECPKDTIKIDISEIETSFENEHTIYIVEDKAVMIPSDNIHARYDEVAIKHDHMQLLESQPMGLENYNAISVIEPVVIMVASSTIRANKDTINVRPYKKITMLFSNIQQIGA